MKLADFCPVPLPAALDLPEEIIIGKQLASDLSGVVSRYLGGAVLLVSDPDCSRAAEHVLKGLPDEGKSLVSFLLPEGPHASDEAVEKVSREAEGQTGLLAVGSGTVNDIVKLAATHRGLPYIVLGTAGSMNGYASGIAAILSRGLKTTVPARPPRGILLDVDILQAAPPEMAPAGLGDVLSKPVSMADWWLAHRLQGSSFSEVPGQLVDDAVRSVTESAAGLAAGDSGAYEALARALVLSGVSMVVAGVSSPASGGEHLMSHLWDMEALVAGRRTRLHGAQVGVATILSAALYQRILRIESPEYTDPPSWEDVEARICREHGALAESVLEPARRKHERANVRVATLRRIWPELREELLSAGIPGPGDVRKPLLLAGAPCTLRDLGLSREDARRVLTRARDIRDRVTILDLAYELGFLPGGMAEVLADSEV